MVFARSLRLAGCLFALVSTAAVATPADDPVAALAAVRAVDLRMATIAYRLTTANAALCRTLAPTPGWVIHSLGQYNPALRTTARQVFGFEAPLAIEAVVPNAPAARAGIAENDSLISVDDTTFAATFPSDATSDSIARDTALAAIGDQSADQPLSVTTIHNGVRETHAVPASPGCRSNFEVLLGPGMDASADGTIVQVAAKFFEKYNDDEVAVVVAHELSHNILQHRARLDAAKVKRGMLAEFGRNGRLFRQTEDDADMLGMYLLRNARYDPQIAVRFWRDHGDGVGGALFRSRTHRSSGARANRIAEEIARIPTDAPYPYIPPILATRDQPLE